MLLPVGAQTKSETRGIAHELGLELIAEKRESQDICFVPDGDHTRVIARTLGAETPALSRGPLVLRDGTVVGEHTGYARFTVGQRRGLPGGFPEPMFVVAIEPATRAVVIGPRDELLGRGVVVREVNWLVDPVRRRAPRWRCRSGIGRARCRGVIVRASAATARSRWRSTSRQARSVLGSRVCSTTATGYSAEA
jgi:tRNA-specific 2-thiouridylase